MISAATFSKPYILSSPRSASVARLSLHHSQRNTSVVARVGAMSGDSLCTLQTAIVKDYYGKELQSSADLKTSACTSCEPPPMFIKQILSKIPEEVIKKTPPAQGIKGLRVRDLGSGSGRDCYAASALVGRSGTVIGVDMTDEQLDGEIEYLDKAGIPDKSVDLVISNCVINLSPDKPRVLEQVYHVYCDRRLPKELQTHPVLLGECLGGALYINDFIRICRQVATYKGTIHGHKSAYDLDDHHRFVKGKPMLVCGNSASMVGETWLAPHFEVTGNRDVHFGQFDCGGGAVPVGVSAAASAGGGAGDCATGACC
eukprot:gene10729-17804_t